jgi:hypothetical protein
MDQRAKVVQFLRNLMRGCCQPGDDVKPDIDEKSPGYRQAARKIVQAVAYQNEAGQRLPADRVGTLTMMPMQELKRP